MEVIFLLFFFCILAKYIWDAFKDKGKEFVFPFLIGLASLGLLLPQAIALSTVDYFPDFAVTRFMIGMCLSLVCIWIGWNYIRVEPLFLKEIQFSNFKLKLNCLGYSLVGAFFYYKLSQWMNNTRFTTEQMSGVSTIFVFLSQLLFIGMTFSLIHFFLAEPLIEHFFSEKWYAGIPVVQYLSLGLSAAAFEVLGVSILKAIGKYKLLRTIRFAGAGLVFGFAYLGARSNDASVLAMYLVFFYLVSHLVLFGVAMGVKKGAVSYD